MNDLGLAEVAESDKADVDKAVGVAREAFTTGDWSRTSAAKRGELLYKLANLIEKHADELARLVQPRAKSSRAYREGLAKKQEEEIEWRAAGLRRAARRL